MTLRPLSILFMLYALATLWATLLPMYPLTRSPDPLHPCPSHLVTVAHQGVVHLCPRTLDLIHDIRLLRVEMPSILTHMTRFLFHHGKVLTCNLGSSMTQVPRPP